MRVLPAKSKCKMPSDFWWKRQVFFHWYIYFFSFLKRSKVISQRDKALFFHQKSEGILHSKKKCFYSIFGLIMIFWSYAILVNMKNAYFAVRINPFSVRSEIYELYVWLQVTDQVKNSLHWIPVGLQEAVLRLVSPDTCQRPSTQLLFLIQYFR